MQTGYLGEVATNMKNIKCLVSDQGIRCCGGCMEHCRSGVIQNELGRNTHYQEGKDVAQCWSCDPTQMQALLQSGRDLCPVPSAKISSRRGR